MGRRVAAGSRGGDFPVPIIAAVLIVGSDRGVAKGLAFVLAWCAGLGEVGTIGLLIGGVAGGSEARERRRG